MMFRCAKGHITKPGERQIKVVTRTRAKTYYGKDGVLQGHGYETVAEEALCAEHAFYALFVKGKV